MLTFQFLPERSSTVLEEVKEITTKQELEEQRKDHPNITDIVMIYLPELEIEGLVYVKKNSTENTHG